MHDRLRARPPTTDADAWTEATVREVARGEGGFEVTVAPANGGEPVVVTVTAAIFELFAGRLEPPAERPAEAVGATVWFK